MSEPVPLVYFLHAENTNLVKIGWTADLDRRFDQLQTACPHKLWLLGVHIGPREVEKIYHHDLAPYRKQGEWFFLTREMRRFVMAGLANHFESNSVFRSFYINRITAETNVYEEMAWQEKAESFAGIPGSQPTRTIDPSLVEAMMGGLVGLVEKMEGDEHVIDAN